MRSKGIERCYSTLSVTIDAHLAISNKRSTGGICWAASRSTLSESLVVADPAICLLTLPTRLARSKYRAQHSSDTNSLLAERSRIDSSHQMIDGTLE